MPPKKRAKLSTASTPLTETQPKTPIETPGPSQKEQFADDVLNDPWTDDQETALLKGLVRWKPTGIHKHFRMLSISNHLRTHGYAPTSPNSTQNQHMRVAGIWAKLGSLYDLESLDERETAYTYMDDPDPVNPDQWGEMTEFDLPAEDFGNMMWERRLPGKKDSGKLGSGHQSPVLVPELQQNQKCPYPPVGLPPPTEELEREDTPKPASPALRGRGSTRGRGRGGRGGRGGGGGGRGKAQSAASESSSSSAEDGEEGDEEEEEESSESEEEEPQARGGRGRGRGRGGRRGRRR